MGSRKMRMRVKLGKVFVETEKRRKKRKEITGKRETGRRLKAGDRDTGKHNNEQTWRRKGLGNKEEQRVGKRVAKEN